MQTEEYQALAMRTSTDDHDRVLNGCLGLIGESGEIVDAVKKWLFQSGDHAELPVVKLIDECGDVLWYCAELATGLVKNLNYYVLESTHAEIQKFIVTRNMGQPLELVAARLANVAQNPFIVMYETVEGCTWGAAEAARSIAFIVAMVQYILKTFCGSTLEEAMERNIEKLRQRYPDGFDPERSLHRAE